MIGNFCKLQGRIYHCRVEPGFNPGQIAAMCAT